MRGVVNRAGISLTMQQAPYRSPECRVAHKERWDEGHRFCPGPVEIRDRAGEVPTQTLTCACRCHHTTDQTKQAS